MKRICMKEVLVPVADLRIPTDKGLTNKIQHEVKT